MDFGPKSNIIKTSLGFQFPTKLISECHHGFIRWFLSKNIDFIHGYPWKSHASVETKKHETSTWTGFCGMNGLLWGNHQLPCWNSKGGNICIYRVNHMFFTMLKLDQIVALRCHTAKPKHNSPQVNSTIYGYMGFTDWIYIHLNDPECPLP